MPHGGSLLHPHLWLHRNAAHQNLCPSVATEGKPVFDTINPMLPEPFLSCLYVLVDHQTIHNHNEPCPDVASSDRQVDGKPKHVSLAVICWDTLDNSWHPLFRLTFMFWLFAVPITMLSKSLHGDHNLATCAAGKPSDCCFCVCMPWQAACQSLGLLCYIPGAFKLAVPACMLQVKHAVVTQQRVTLP